MEDVETWRQALKSSCLALRVYLASKTAQGLEGKIRSLGLASRFWSK